MRYRMLDAPLVMRTRYWGLGENRMTDFHWEVQGILHGGEDVRLILKKIELSTNLASGEELQWKETHILCMRVEKSQEGDRDFDPELSDMEQCVQSGLPQPESCS